MDSHMIPWHAGKCMTRDATLNDTVVESYLLAALSAAGSAAENTECWKESWLLQPRYNNGIFKKYRIHSVLQEQIAQVTDGRRDWYRHV
jgi:hypothetical protein